MKKKLKNNSNDIKKYDNLLKKKINFNNINKKYNFT